MIKWFRKTIKLNGCKVIINDGERRGLCCLGLHDLHRTIHYYPGRPVRSYSIYECHYCDYSKTVF